MLVNWVVRLVLKKGFGNFFISIILFLCGVSLFGIDKRLFGWCIENKGVDLFFSVCRLVL